MKNDIDYIAFCRDKYEKEWKVTFESCSKNGGWQNVEALRLYAQRMAIDKTFIDALLNYPDIQENEIWAAIGTTHKLHVAGLEQFGINDIDEQEKVLKQCLSAHQSWIKAGGHSFERYIASMDNERLQENEIKFILQSDLTKMVKNNELANTPEDIKGLNEWGKDFDLYAIQTVHGEKHVFGCIQSKTSIRDRVGRDVTFSHNAMDGLFWSVAVTLDGDFLNMQEFKNMVNGGGSYPLNGWHGMYAMSGIDESLNRIYKVDEKLDLFIDHAIKAAKQFISDRRLLNHDWKAN